MAEAGATDENIQAIPVYTRRSTATTEDGESGENCRICRGSATPEQPLFYPCKCSGSIKYVHQECLMEWLSHSQKKYCELCKTPFTFTKLYHQSMPDTLPLPLFLRQISVDGARACAKWLRYVVVTLIWIGWLPWSIRQVWRGLFWLADGSWMTAQDFRQLATGEAASRSSWTAVNQTATVMATSTQALTATFVFRSPLSFLLDLFTGDALLRSLLRFISQTPVSTANTAQTTQRGNFSVTLTAYQSGSKRGPSVLSDIQSLNSFTRYAFINNALVDILEGQLVCLAIITVFILIFLIREWVLNQQPNAAMPDQDLADVPNAAVNEDDVGRGAGIRRRRAGLRRLREEGGQLVERPAVAGQRPRDILRHRRAATEDNIAHQQSPTREDEPPSSQRAASLVPTMTPNLPITQPTLDTVDSSGLARSNSLPQNARNPPLQRGMFDDVVDIRRNIEERNLHDSSEHTRSNSQPALIGTHDFAVESNVQALSTAAPHMRSSLDMESDTVMLSRSGDDEELSSARHNSSVENDFSAATAIPESEDHTISDGDHSAAAVGNNNLTPAQEDFSQEPPEIGSVGSLDDTTRASLQGVTEVTTSDENNTVDPPAGDDPAPPDLLERLAVWLWQTDQYHAPEALIPTEDSEQVIRDVNAEAPFVPANIPEAVQPQAAPPAPGHEPNVQFGVDLNDPNMMDEAEELEGILELMGLEGPLVGMVQNTVFSLFLISLTLSASVWCPYIWGKIAFVVMSSPINVFLKAPLFFISRVADILVDVMLLTIGGMGFLLTKSATLLKAVAVPVIPGLARIIKVGTVEEYAIGLSKGSSIRLEKALSGTVFHLKPDLPTFSMQSHHVLRAFERSLNRAISAIANDLLSTITAGEELWKTKGVLAIPSHLVREIITFPQQVFSVVNHSVVWARTLSNDLRLPDLRNAEALDNSLLEWNAKDRVIATMAGYVFFALAGVAYLKVSRIFYRLRQDEKVDGILADSLRQAGGVLKVIFIIGIEMIAFPLYCGCLLDIALLPLFRDATIGSRIAFVGEAPATGLFIHWFLGTCYMFHFALFVSMCRKILRRGVLYFIRDPDDPTFHPVRDVLERRVLTQLSKILWSAGVYGGLVTLCLGVVIWSLCSVDGIFPIEWTTHEPRLGFPIDIVFFNFILPLVLRQTEPSKKISTMYEWWFRVCARVLKLSHFLFGEIHKEEMTTKAILLFPQLYPSPPEASDSPENETATTEKDPNSDHADGTWVRAPAADQVRIPKGANAFLEVDSNNERIDGQPDSAKGLHGKDDDRFTKIFIPPFFKYRITTFIFLVWLFASSTGVAFTVGPLLVGRKAIKVITSTSQAPNDLYAFTVGMQICGAATYLLAMAITHKASLKASVKAQGWIVLLNLKERLPQLFALVKHSMSLLYIGVFVGLIIPILLSITVEVYVHMPVYILLSRSSSWRRTTASDQAVTSSLSLTPTIYLVQTWTLGLLYLRLLIRVVTNYPHSSTRAATAIKTIIRNGFVRPNVRLTTRALIVPVVVCCFILLTLPLGLAKVVISISGTSDKASMMWMYRYSYPILLITAIDVYVLSRLKSKIARWQIRVRDEIYLVGERLHNFAETQDEEKTRQALATKEGIKGTDVDAVH